MKRSFYNHNIQPDSTTLAYIYIYISKVFMYTIVIFNLTFGSLEKKVKALIIVSLVFKDISLLHHVKAISPMKVNTNCTQSDIEPYSQTTSPYFI